MNAPEIGWKNNVLGKISEQPVLSVRGLGSSIPNYILEHCQGHWLIRCESPWQQSVLAWPEKVSVMLMNTLSFSLATHRNVIRNVIAQPYLGCDYSISTQLHNVRLWHHLITTPRTHTLLSLYFISSGCLQGLMHDWTKLWKVCLGWNIKVVAHWIVDTSHLQALFL